MMILTSRTCRPWDSRSGAPLAIWVFLVFRVSAFVLVAPPSPPHSPALFTASLSRWEQPQAPVVSRLHLTCSSPPRLFHTFLGATDKKKLGMKTTATSNSSSDTMQQPTTKKAKKQKKSAPSSTQTMDKGGRRKTPANNKRNSTAGRKPKTRSKTREASAKCKDDKTKQNATRPATVATGNKQNAKANGTKRNSQNDKQNDPHPSSWVDDTDVQEILNSVSDAQALLACRAYLVKRRQWTTKTDHDKTSNNADDGKGWTEWKRRQVAQQQTAEDESTGVFWEDLSQLQYWNPLANPLRWQQEQQQQEEEEGNFTNTTGTERENNVLLNLGLRDNDDQDEASDIARHSTDTDASTALVGEDAFVSLAAWNEAYQEQDEGGDVIDSSLTLEDTEPSPEYLRRSEARRKKFSDTEWKAYWYQRRWGNRRRPSHRIVEERLHQRLSALWQSSSQAQVLAPVAEMSQEEMTQAIVEYVLANRKRSESQLAWRQEQIQTRKQRRRQKLSLQDSEAERLPRDALLQVNRTILQEKQKARAERARKAYQARLGRQEREAKLLSKDKQSHSRTRKGKEAALHYAASSEDSLSPKDALQRIEVALNEGTCPHYYG